MHDFPVWLIKKRGEIRNTKHVNKVGFAESVHDYLDSMDSLKQLRLSWNHTALTTNIFRTFPSLTSITFPSSMTLQILLIRYRDSFYCLCSCTHLFHFYNQNSYQTYFMMITCYIWQLIFDKSMFVSLKNFLISIRNSDETETVIAILLFVFIPFTGRDSLEIWILSIFQYVLFQIKWAKEHDEAAYRMAEHGTIWARNHLRYEEIFCYYGK